MGDIKPKGFYLNIKSKQWLPCIFTFLVLCTYPTIFHANEGSRIGDPKKSIRNNALMIFGGTTGIAAFGFAILKKLHSNKDLLNSLENPILWLGCAVGASIVSGIYYGTAKYNSREAIFNRLATEYERIQQVKSSHIVCANRHASDEIFCGAVVRCGSEKCVRTMQAKKALLLNSFLSSFSTFGINLHFALFLSTLHVGLVLLERLYSLDDPRTDLILLHTACDLAELRKIILELCDNLKKFVDSLDKDDELIEQCHVYVTELSQMIPEIEACIARIVGTKQWFELITDAEIVANGLTGTKTIPHQFVESICESIRCFDDQYHQRSNARGEVDSTGGYIRYDKAENTTLADWGISGIVLEVS